MIRLSKIRIEGFKNSKNTVEVQLADNQVTVIFGDNGCGKTTFLKIIHAVLSQDESTLISEDVNKIVINYLYQDQDSESIESHEITIGKILFNEEDEATDFENIHEYHYDWSEFEASDLAISRSISLGVDRGSPSSRLSASTGQLHKFISSRRRLRSNFNTQAQFHEFIEELSDFLLNKRRRMPNTLMSEGNVDHIFIKEINMENVGETLHARYRSARRNAARRVQSALFDTLALAIKDQQDSSVPQESEIPDEFDDLIFKNRELIVEALDDSQENRFKDTIIFELKKISNIDDVSKLKDNLLLSKLLLKMSEQLKDSEEELFAVNTVIDKFDSFTSEGKSLKINIDSITVKSKTGDHSINELSSGERHILTLFTLLLDQGRDRDLIIIDEPEISLNSKWQEILLPTLSKILPYSQIIVASHSPIIAQSIDDLAELEVK